MMKKLFLTIILLTAPLTTHAYFSDTQTSATSMSAGRIAFDMTATTTQLTSGTTSFTFTINDESTQSPQYNFTIADQTCGITFTFNASIEFDGEHTVEAVGITTPCQVTVLAEAWQQSIGYGNGGFTASSSLTFVFTDPSTPQQTATVVLNEIYPNEFSGASSTAPLLHQEWVELYNGTNAPVDIEGWFLGEEPGGSGQARKHIISYTNTCASGSKEGFARPYGIGASTVIPAGGLLVVEFCASNKMHNNGDTIHLYNAANIEVDFYNYPATAVGKSHARIPDGWHWVDPIPTPGEVNKATLRDLEEDGTWTAEMIEYAIESGAMIPEPEHQAIGFTTLIFNGEVPDESGDGIVADEEAKKDDDPIINESGEGPLIGDRVEGQDDDEDEEIEEDKEVVVVIPEMVEEGVMGEPPEEAGEADNALEEEEDKVLGPDTTSESEPEPEPEPDPRPDPEPDSEPEVEPAQELPADVNLEAL